MSTTTPTSNRAAFEQPVAIRPHVSFQEPETNRPHSSRPRPKHLQPLAIGQVIPSSRRHSGTYVRYPVTGNALASQFPHSPSEDTPSSATSLATPSLAAVRQYYKDNNLRTVFQGPNSPRVPPNTPAYNTRRASILTPTSLTARFDKLAASSPVLARGQLRSPIVLRSPDFTRGEAPVGRTYRQRSIVDESRGMLLENLPSSEVCRLVSAVMSSGPMVERRPSLPAKPPKDRLREFGHLYLDNILTSDVLVKALHIRKVEQIGRRDSVMSNHSDMDSHEINVPMVGQDAEHIMLRARVIPCAKERKPFMIQRRLNKSDLKAMSATHSVEQKSTQSPVTGRKSLPTRQTPKSPRKNGGKETRTTMHMHVDYALRYLPVLALLLLSGHIRKGDQIDLPLPHPDAWSETVAWVYTGRGTLSDAARKNIEHLGGPVVSEVEKENEEKKAAMREEDSDSELSEPPEYI